MFKTGDLLQYTSGTAAAVYSKISGPTVFDIFWLKRGDVVLYLGRNKINDFWIDVLVHDRLLFINSGYFMDLNFKKLIK